MNKEYNHGGKRTSSGRKPKPTKVINFRLPEVRILFLREKYGKKLRKMFNEWQSGLEKDTDL